MEQKDTFLFILLGFDSLYSINLKHLQEEEDLPIVFNHKTHKIPGSRNPYPFGMGLFVHDSKLHFFGGENFDADTANDGFQNLNFEISKDPPKKLDCPSLNFLSMENLKEWINTKVFSFTPLLKKNQPPALRPELTPLIPPPSSYKMRPIVFTFSDKVYALATRPFSGSLVEAGINENQDLFEVFEPCKTNNGIIKWQWAKLPNPPDDLSRLIHGSIPGGLSRTLPIFHCVIKNLLVLQTWIGDYIFDMTLRKWFVISQRDNDDYGIILASLEFNGRLLLLFDGGCLMYYDLKSDVEYKGGIFWKSLFWGDDCKGILYELGGITNNNSILTATLSIVDDNSICIVLSCYVHIYICHFEFTKSPCQVVLKAHKKFYLAPVTRTDPYTLSSFILESRNGDVGKSNQDSTTGDGEWKQVKPTKSR